LWIAEHEPEVFRRVATVLLPKDWLRLCLTGERVSEMSDAAGTLWLDVAARRWSEEMLAASGLTLGHVPRLVEGSERSGALRPAIAEEWGLPAGVVVAGGGGDNAAGAVGVGVVRAGQAFLSLGTSGVYFVAGDAFRRNPESAVHAFCHCLPRTWHQMSVVLSAASCLTWVTALTAAPSEAALLDETERAFSGAIGRSGVVFLPYLSGERTPHNDPNATGVFFGLTHETMRAELCRAVLEGVAFALADGEDVLRAAGAEIRDVGVIGGGARSRLWGRILASALGRPLRYAAEGELGPAFGAARLARLALGGESIDAVCAPPEISWVAEPDAALQDVYRERRDLFRRLYRDLRETFCHTAAPDEDHGAAKSRARSRR
jgi:xylulokinase